MTETDTNQINHLSNIIGGLKKRIKSLQWKLQHVDTGYWIVLKRTDFLTLLEKANIDINHVSLKDFKMERDNIRCMWCNQPMEPKREFTMIKEGTIQHYRQTDLYPKVQKYYIYHKDCYEQMNFILKFKDEEHEPKSKN